MLFAVALLLNSKGKRQCAGSQFIVSSLTAAAWTWSKQLHVHRHMQAEDIHATHFWDPHWHLSQGVCSGRYVFVQSLQVCNSVNISLKVKSLCMSRSIQIFPSGSQVWQHCKLNCRTTTAATTTKSEVSLTPEDFYQNLQMQFSSVHAATVVLNFPNAETL